MLAYQSKLENIDYPHSKGIFVWLSILLVLFISGISNYLRYIQYEDYELLKNILCMLLKIINACLIIEASLLYISRLIYLNHYLSLYIYHTTEYPISNSLTSPHKLPYHSKDQLHFPSKKWLLNNIPLPFHKIWLIEKLNLSSHKAHRIHH